MRRQLISTIPFHRNIRYIMKIFNKINLRTIMHDEINKRSNTWAYANELP